jgi:ankyrin repeat protein
MEVSTAFHPSCDPLKQPRIMEAAKETTTINDIPNEILLKVAQYLDNDALFDFAFTSREFMRFCLDFDLLDSESRNSYGRTLLIEATEYHIYDVLEFLLEAGLDPHEKWQKSDKVDDYEVGDYVDKTPLHLAVEIGDRKLLKILLKHMEDLEDGDYYKDTALELAFTDRNLDFVCRLIKAGASIDRQDPEIIPFLIEATIQQNTDMVKALLKCHDVDVDVKWEPRKKGITDLMKAEAVEFFNIKPPKSYYVREHYGKTALHLAVELGDMDTVKVLVEGNADVNESYVVDEGWTALYRAISRDDIPMTKYLLENGADPNFKPEFTCDGPPIFVASSEEMVDLLICHGVDLSVTEDEWSTKTGHEFVEELRSELKNKVV